MKRITLKHRHKVYAPDGTATIYSKGDVNCSDDALADHLVSEGVAEYAGQVSDPPIHRAIKPAPQPEPKSDPFAGLIDPED